MLVSCRETKEAPGTCSTGLEDQMESPGTEIDLAALNYFLTSGRTESSLICTFRSLSPF